MRGVFYSLRFRLTVWYVLTLALLIVAFEAALYGVVRHWLHGHHDEELRDAWIGVAKVIRDERDCADFRHHEVLDLGRQHQVVLFPDGAEGHRICYASQDSPAQPVLDPPTPSALPEEGRFDTAPATSEAIYRIYSRPYRARTGQHGVIQIVTKLGDVTGPLASFRLTLILLTPFAALVAAAGGYWLAGRALAPVDEITRLAREIEASSLSRRLPLPKAHDEIGRLVDTMNQMIGRLEASFDGVTRLTADASHELRAPLARMRGAIDVAMARPRSADEYREVLTSVSADVNHLRALVQDLLVLARADAGRIKLTREPVQLAELAQEVTESFLASAHGKEIDLACEHDGPVRVMGDERWLSQLVTNLVDNAIKYSERGDSVRVRVSIEGQNAILSVRDTGPGMPEDAVERIFERFYRNDDSRGDQTAPGFGLGLAIVSWIVQAHDGTVSAESAPGKGTCFRATLPALS